jgi:hypothetical protein
MRLKKMFELLNIEENLEGEELFEVLKKKFQAYAESGLLYCRGDKVAHLWSPFRFGVEFSSLPQEWKRELEEIVASAWKNKSAS